MNNDMITIQCEFKMRTPLGFDTRCEVNFDVWRDFTDAQTIDKVVKWCRKAVTTPTMREPMITFIYGDGSPYGVSTSRVFGWLGGNFTQVKWKSHNDYDLTENIKPTAKLFREHYMECVKRMGVSA